MASKPFFDGGRQEIEGLEGKGKRPGEEGLREGEEAAQGIAGEENENRRNGVKDARSLEANPTGERKRPRFEVAKQGNCPQKKTQEKENPNSHAEGMVPIVEDPIAHKVKVIEAVHRLVKGKRRPQAIDANVGQQTRLGEEKAADEAAVKNDANGDKGPVASLETMIKQGAHEDVSKEGKVGANQENSREGGLGQIRAFLFWECHNPPIIGDLPAKRKSGSPFAEPKKRPAPSNFDLDGSVALKTIAE
jgi:hypothetical protein